MLGSALSIETIDKKLFQKLEWSNGMFKKFLPLIVATCSVIFMQPAMAAVEINTADQAQLDSVAGIGPSTSRAILEERKKHGNFKDWNDLEQRVRGIGERNSIKLSAAGLTVNGQSHNAKASASKSSPAVKAVKVSKDSKAVSKDGKETPQPSEADK